MNNNSRTSVPPKSREHSKAKSGKSTDCVELALKVLDPSPTRDELSEEAGSQMALDLAPFALFVELENSSAAIIAGPEKPIIIRTLRVKLTVKAFELSALMATFVPMRLRCLAARRHCQDRSRRRNRLVSIRELASNHPNIEIQRTEMKHIATDDPESLPSGVEEARGFTYENSRCDWPDEVTYWEAVAGIEP